MAGCKPSVKYRNHSGTIFSSLFSVPCSCLKLMGESWDLHTPSSAGKISVCHWSGPSALARLTLVILYTNSWFTQRQNSTLSFLPKVLEGSPHLGCWFQRRRHSHQYQSLRCLGALQPLFGILKHSPKSGREDRLDSEALSGLKALKTLDQESGILHSCGLHLFNLRPPVSVLGLVTGEGNTEI